MLNEKLKEIRKLYKVKQAEIAQYLNITQASYSHYEKGIREPDIKTLKKICKELKTSPNELLEYEE